MRLSWFCRYTRKKEVDVVLEGGGVKAIALLGAVVTLMQRGYRIRKIAASSGGAIPALMFAAGYTPAEMKKFLGRTNFSKLPDDTFWLKMRGIGALLKLYRLISCRGIYPGINVSRWVELILEGRAKTFRELPVDFRVTAYDITNREVVIFSKRTHPNLRIADAIRATISYPLVFYPIPYRENGKERNLIDGGFAVNFPIDVFDKEKDRRGRPLTIGFKLVSTAPKETVYGIDSIGVGPPEQFIQFIIGFAHLAIDNQERFYISRPAWNRVVPIDVGEVTALNFNIDAAGIERLYDAGCRATNAFLDNLEWEESWWGLCARLIPGFVKKFFKTAA